MAGKITAQQAHHIYWWSWQPPFSFHPIHSIASWLSRFSGCSWLTWLAWWALYVDQHQMLDYSYVYVHSLFCLMAPLLQVVQAPPSNELM